jgi:thioredoxin-related protein
MLTRNKSLVALGCALLAASLSAQADEIDLSLEASAADAQGRSLMLVLVEADCDTCDRALALLRGDAETASFIAENFHVVTSSVNDSFSVVCPEGTQLGNVAFREMKGVDRLPALVFTDEQGNVVYRHDEAITAESLQAVGAFVRQKRYAEGRSFEQWVRQNNPSL